MKEDKEEGDGSERVFIYFLIRVWKRYRIEGRRRGGGNERREGRRESMRKKIVHKGESLKSGEDDSLGRRVWKVLLEQENILVFNTEHLKTSKGFQEPSYFLFSPLCAKLFWQAFLQVSQNIHKFRFYLGINPQRGSIKINWNAKAQLQLLQEIRSKLAVNLKCQYSAYLTF